MENFSVLALLLLPGVLFGLARSQQCGVSVSQGKIVGGVDSGGYRYPWFALLLLKKYSFLPVPICAGSLISELYVLTAAHCFNAGGSVQNKNLYTVALGVYDICDGKEQTREIFNMADVVVHEKYQKRGKFFDISLIKLDRPAIYTVVCLPFPGVPDLTELALIIGFGATKENSDLTPCHMLEVNVTKYSKKDCANTKLPPEDKSESSVICAGALSGAVDSCYGDSGGPLLTRTPDGRYVLSGIVSYGYGCGVPDVPGVYTNVGSYLSWIGDKISVLDSKTPKASNKRRKSDPFDRRPRPEDQGARVLFPGNFSKPSDGVPEIGLGPANGRKLNRTVSQFDGENRRNKPSNKMAKNTRVIFPGE